MAKYGGLDGTSTANLDLYQEAKTQHGWETYVPFRKVSFIPETDCSILVGEDAVSIKVKADIGWNDENAQITKFIIEDASIVYVFSYRY